MLCRHVYGDIACGGYERDQYLKGYKLPLRQIRISPPILPIIILNILETGVSSQEVLISVGGYAESETVSDRGVLESQ